MLCCKERDPCLNTLKVRFSSLGYGDPVLLLVYLDTLALIFPWPYNLAILLAPLLVFMHSQVEGSADNIRVCMCFSWMHVKVSTVTRLAGDGGEVPFTLLASNLQQSFLLLQTLLTICLQERKNCPESSPCSVNRRGAWTSSKVDTQLSDKLFQLFLLTCLGSYPIFKLHADICLFHAVTL